MSSPVEKIKERLSIVDVISSYIQVVESGKNYKARCPFHNEKTPSFFISSDRGTYYCFGCGEKGDIFSFVQKFEGTDFLGSLKLLAEKAGVDLPSWKPSDSKDQTEVWYQIMEEATLFFESSYSKIQEPRSYLMSRGLSDSTIKSFRIGYAPDSWRSVSDHLIKMGFKINDIEMVGLVKKSESGFYDRFRGRIMFPISDSSGRVIAFSGRIFLTSNTKPKVEEAKYLNSPDTPLFNKSNVLFGIDKAKQAIRSRGYSIIVEGQMDLIMSHQALFANTVAVSGTALADTVNDHESKINNLGLIRRLSSNIIFAFDGDDAGIRACSRASMIALSLDMQVKVAVLPKGKDPADIILESQDKWKDIIKNSVNIIDFHLDRICNETTDPRIRGRKVREVIFPFIILVKSAIERSAYINAINKKTGLSEKAINEDFENFEKNHQTQSNIQVEKKDKSNNQSRRQYLEKQLMGIIFWQKDQKEQTLDIDKLINDLKVKIGEEEFGLIFETYEPFKDTLAFEAEMWYGSKINELERSLNELLLNTEEEILIQRKTLLQPLDTEEKLVEFNKISKRIEDIKKNRSQQ
jgi:DNA primase